MKIGFTTAGPCARLAICVGLVFGPTRISRESSLAFSHFMRLSSMKAAHAVVSSVAYRKSGIAHTKAVEKGSAMTIHAHGNFEVKLTPQLPEDKSEGSTLGRMLIEKQFHGDLEAVSNGQMLTGMTAVQGSGAYVAIERVTGTLNGRRGSFILHHLGIMTRGAPQLNVTVVPDSGTDELAGIAGTMTILIADGKHSYDFAYTLPEAH
jgi:hypothetical protein